MGGILFIIIVIIVVLVVIFYIRQLHRRKVHSFEGICNVLRMITQLLALCTYHII